MYKNEAAERLRGRLTGDIPWLVTLDAALAEERRHVIEQIRERLEAASLASDQWYGGAEVAAILDDLSAEPTLATQVSTPEPLDPAWDKGDEWRSDYSTPEQK